MRYFTSCLSLFMLLFRLTTSSLTANETTPSSSIDTLILYSPAAEDHYHGGIESRIYHILEETNQRYQEHELSLQIHPVKLLSYPISESLSLQETITELQQDPTIETYREKYGADQVLLYRLYHPEDQGCGIAYINQDHQPQYAFALVAINCATYHTAHELGHSLGLYHSEKSNPDVGYARGYGVEDTFSTIMAYSDDYHGKKIYTFSNPNRECEGLPCGIPQGEAHEADAVQALQESAPFVARFKPHQANSDRAITQALTTLLESYEELYLDANKTLHQLQDDYEKADQAYQTMLQNFQNVMEQYTTQKRHYLKLQANHPKEAQIYYQAHLKPILSHYKSDAFAELYHLETRRNKLKLSYESYREQVYLPAKLQFNTLKEQLSHEE